MRLVTTPQKACMICIVIILALRDASEINAPAIRVHWRRDLPYESFISQSYTMVSKVGRRMVVYI